MSREGRHHELFEEATDGTAFRAHPSLFHDHVPFFVELAKHRVQESFRFQVTEEFDLVGRERIKIAGDVGAGKGVDGNPAFPFNHVREFVLLHERRGGFLLAFKDVRQVFDAFGVGRGIQPGFLKSQIRQFQFLQGLFLFFIVFGAEARGAFKSHVFEHVREPGPSRVFLRRPYVHGRHKGEHRGYGAFNENKGPAVLDGVFRDVLLEGRKVYCWRSGRKTEDAEQKQDENTSWRPLCGNRKHRQVCAKVLSDILTSSRVPCK